MVHARQSWRPDLRVKGLIAEDRSIPITSARGPVDQVLAGAHADHEPDPPWVDRLLESRDISTRDPLGLVRLGKFGPG